MQVQGTEYTQLHTWSAFVSMRATASYTENNSNKPYDDGVHFMEMGRDKMLCDKTNIYKIVIKTITLRYILQFNLFVVLRSHSQIWSVFFVQFRRYFWMFADETNSNHTTETTVYCVLFQTNGTTL